MRRLSLRHSQPVAKPQTDENAAHRWFVVAPANPPVQEVLSREGFEYINLPTILPPC
jgi:hypothetical protein